MRRVILFYFLRKSSVGEGELPDFFSSFLSLFSRSRAGLATVSSSFFGLATNTLNVRNNKNNCRPDVTTIIVEPD